MTQKRVMCATGPQKIKKKTDKLEKEFMAYTVYKSGKTKWRLVERVFDSEGKRTAKTVPKTAYHLIGFRPDMTLEEARDRAKQLTKQNDSATYSRNTATAPMAMLLRAYIEFKFSFSASWASTPEFLGSFKAATLSLNKSPDFYQNIERVLYALDVIRFAKKDVSQEELKSIAVDFEKITQDIDSMVPDRERGGV